MNWKSTLLLFINNDVDILRESFFNLVKVQYALKAQLRTFRMIYVYNH